MRRELWILAVVSFCLGAAAPIIRHVNGHPGSGSWAIYLSVALMVVTLIAIRKEREALSLTLQTNLVGLAGGATVGFAAVCGLHFTTMGCLLVGKWAVGAIVLALLLRRTIRNTDLAARDEAKWAAESARIETMSPEEQKAHFEGILAEFNSMAAASKRMNRRVWIMTALGVMLALVAFFLPRLLG